MTEGFYERFPRCGEFGEIYDWLRSLEISADVAAEVAKSLLWISNKSGRGKAGRPAALNAEQIDQVLQLHTEWNETQTAFTKAAAQRFGVSEETIRLAIKRRGLK